ncbi:MAG TPA: TetR family transcriptional regulator [Rhizomicrobium sp.]
MQNNQSSEDSQDRALARAALMQAARAVAEREGVESVTLSKVASEAGLPRAAVYGQFARKEDLLMSIVSDDLAALARSLHGIDWPQGGDTPESAVILSLPRAPETPAEMIDIAKDVSVALAAAPTTEAPAPRQRLARRADLTQVPEAKPTADDSEAKPAEAPRAPDAWLERRLRVFERGMSGVEARQDQVEKNARAAAIAAEESIKALEATVAELKARADAADARHKTSANEVRTALNETSLRLQTVEGVARAALAENNGSEASIAEPVAAPAEPAPAEPAPAVVDAAPADAAPKSFIADVRKSVAAASAAAEAEAKVEVEARKGRKSLTRYLLGTLVVLTIFIAAAGMAFSKGVDDGRREALTHMMRPAPRTLGAPTALDRLSARALSGDAAAQLQVGMRYLNATPKNVAEAMRWVTLAAVHGQPVAQYLLGTLDAQGTPADAAKALQWYEAAALQGNRKAMHALAVAYAEGLGTAKSPSEAVRWFSRAAGFGYVDSQFNLAVLYERGDGVPQSLLDAYKWYAVAGRQGDAESRSRIEALRTQLSGDDLAAAQHAADAFRAMPLDVAANVAP